MKRLWHALARLVLVSGTLVPVYLSYFLPWLRQRLFGSKMTKARWSALHTKNAERFYRLAVRMRGGFIKIGQLISVRVDVAPKEWTDSLSRLQDRVEPTAWPAIEAHLTAELGAAPRDVFREIDEVAVAAASFGQVHRAVTAGGREVALKVRYADIEMKLAIDMFMAGIAVPLFNIFVPKLKLGVIYREMRGALETELNYEQEARWTKRIHDNLADVEQVVVPELLPEYTTRSVICTTFFEGHRVTDRAKLDELGVDLHELVRVIIAAYSHMVFVDGVFQSDPHPGNLLFRADEHGKPELCVLDFGQVKELPAAFQQKMIHSSIAFMGRDVDGFQRSLVDLGLLTDKDAETARPILDEFFENYFEMTPAEAQKLDFEKIRDDLKVVVDRIDGLTIPQDIILYGRTVGLLSGLVTTLDENINGFVLARPMIMQALLRPSNLASSQ